MTVSSRPHLVSHTPHATKPCPPARASIGAWCRAFASCKYLDLGVALPLSCLCSTFDGFEHLMPHDGILEGRYERRSITKVFGQLRVGLADIVNEVVL